MRLQARKALEQVEAAIAAIAELTAIETWLEEPQARPLRRRGVPTAASAGRVTSNRQGLGADAVLAFARELVDPPAGPVAAERA